MRRPAVLPLLLATALIGCGGDDAAETTDATRELTSEPTGATTAPAPPPADTERPDPKPADPDDRPAPSEPASEPEKQAAAEEAEAAYTDYIEAINERDGEALCTLLSPAAIRALRPPVERSTCEASMSESIGYEDPRGYPVWERTVLNGIESVAVGDDPGTVRLTAATLTEFEDRNEPSVESDIAYMEMAGDSWRLVQPTAAIYRAVGRPELPPSVIAPPPG